MTLSKPGGVVLRPRCRRRIGSNADWAAIQADWNDSIASLRRVSAWAGPGCCNLAEAANTDISLTIDVHSASSVLTRSLSDTLIGWGDSETNMVTINL